MEEEETLLGFPALSKYKYYRKHKLQFTTPRFRSAIAFVVTALFSGLLFYFILFSLVLSRPSLHALSNGYLYDDAYATVTVYPPSPTYLEENPPGLNVDGLLEMSPEELRAMIATTDGYFARDWSLYLGWNNMRYIIEAALFHSGLLNRTLIIPSFVYARACEYDNDVCAKYATMVNRNDATGVDAWRDRPPEKQMAWKIPIEVMMDIPHVRQKHKFITTSEYLTLQGLNITREASTGRWDRDYYHNGVDHPTLFVLQRNAWDPKEIARVDSWDPAVHQRTITTSVSREMAVKCDEKLTAKSNERGQALLSWEEASEAIKQVMGRASENKVELALKAAGWVILHTFAGHSGMVMTKSVAIPIREVARHDRIHGLVQEYKDVTQDVLLSEGELHDGKRPGFLFYTTEEARDKFARIVLQDVRVSGRVHALAEKVMWRMSRFNNGRTWMAGHMRRGDFTYYGWIAEATIEDHFRRFMDRLGNGRITLKNIHNLSPEPYNVPDAQPNLALWSKKPPVEGDYIYLATDERSEDGLRYLREHKALLFEDLVEKEDRRAFGWPLLFTDVVALVEQQVIGLGAGYFYGHSMSSLAGGILNIRASSGCDRRTTQLDSEGPPQS